MISPPLEAAELWCPRQAGHLGVGECGETACTARLPLGRAIDVYVVADPDGTETECHEGNNYGLQPDVACDTVD